MQVEFLYSKVDNKLYVKKETNIKTQLLCSLHWEGNCDHSKVSLY